MPSFQPLREDSYGLDIHAIPKGTSTGLELSFCQPLTLPDSSYHEVSDMDRWGNILYNLLQRQLLDYVEQEFYVSSYSSLDRRLYLDKHSLQISFFHKDSDDKINGTGPNKSWREAILEFTASTVQQSECVKGQYTGGSVQATSQGTLAGYIALPTDAFAADHYLKFYADDIGSALVTLLYGKELQIYDSFHSRNPFHCTAGSVDVSLRINNPTVRIMKNSLKLVEEIKSFFSEYRPLLESSFREIGEARRELELLSSKCQGMPLFQHFEEGDVQANITEKLQRPAETLQRLHSQFPKSLLMYASSL
ncbi:hypothetical protein HYU22_02420 [Candidatus Woesearchaeota archaeon]|nr:hypothetical protein [Candidatus Woesearchaeota archaeon]